MGSFAIGTEQIVSNGYAKDNGVIIIQNTSATEKLLLTFLAVATEGNEPTTFYIRTNPTGLSNISISEVHTNSVTKYDTDFIADVLGKTEFSFKVQGSADKELCIGDLGIELFENDTLAIFAKGENNNLVGINIRWDEIII